MARNVEALLVYQKAVAASAEISAIIRRPVFRQDRRLRDQLGSASERVISTIAEGSEQSTDRYYAQYLYRSRGSSREVRTQLIVACQRRYITEDERVDLSRKYEEIGKMLTGLIRYLQACDGENRP